MYWRDDKYNIHNFEEYFSNEIEKEYEISRKKNYGGNKKEIKESYKSLEKKIEDLQKELWNHPLERITRLENDKKKCSEFQKKFQKQADRWHLYLFQGSNGNLLYCPAKPIPLSDQELEELKEAGKPTCGWRSSKEGRNYAINCLWPDGYRLPTDFPSYIPGNWRESLIEPKEPREGGWED